MKTVYGKKSGTVAALEPTSYSREFFTAENSNSDAIYHFKSFVSQILPVCVMDSDGSKSFIL